MNTKVTCPACGEKFNADEVLSNTIEKEIREKLTTENRAMLLRIKENEDKLLEDKKRFEEMKQQENKLFMERLDKEKALLEKKMESDLRASLQKEHEQKWEFMQQSIKEKDEKIKELNQKEIEVMRLNKLIQEQELEKEKMLEEQRIKIEIELKQKWQEQIKQEAELQFQPKIKEYELKLQQQAKLIEEQKRKMEQGSMEQQGEVQEMILLEKLKSLYPFDEFREVSKGEPGGDIIQLVRNKNGQTCGTILYEIKNAKNWLNVWVEKLNSDVRNLKADAGFIVTKVFPKHINQIGKMDNIWICGQGELDGLSAMMRDAIIQVFQSKQSEENKGEKMVMLYNYLNSNEFRQKWDAILSGFRNMKKTIDKQREFYNKTLAEQEQIANSILINANNFIGSIQGIAGGTMDDIKLLE